MEREFLEALGLDGETVETLLGEYEAKLAPLREELETERTRAGELAARLAARDYDEAAARELAGKGVRFSSKGAEKSFLGALREKGLTVRDGRLEGFDEFLREQREADPGAFENEKPSFVRPVGAGGAPSRKGARAAELAARYHQNRYGVKESD